MLLIKAIKVCRHQLVVVCGQDQVEVGGGISDPQQRVGGKRGLGVGQQVLQMDDGNLTQQRETMREGL